MEFIPKKLRSFPQIGEHSWLIHHLMIDFLAEAASKYASGIMADIGCGHKPYHCIFAPYTSQHIGVDLAESVCRTSTADVIGSAYDTRLQESSCDVVLCTEVLEHLEEPLSAIKEMNRILKHKGIVILTAPFFWHIHEAPRDFYRYSEYGLCYLFEQAGFEIVEIRPLTGYIATFVQLSIYFLMGFQRGYVLRIAQQFLGGASASALRLNRYDGSTDFTNLYGPVAPKTKQI